MYGGYCPSVGECFKLLSTRAVRLHPAAVDTVGTIMY